MEITVQMKQFSTEHEAIRKSLGFGIHGDETTKALKRQGVMISDKARVVLHQCPPHLAEPVKGKINVLYTATEAPDLPPDFVEKAKRMDLIVGTSKFVRNAFSKHLPKRMLEVCSLGVDTNLFSSVKRKYKEPFVYLWVGAPDERKGWVLIKSAWVHFEARKDCMLVIKTTGRNKLERSGNVLVDSRKLSKEKLARIYQFAHCFIFPSFGEGFGLTLAEAMSTGLPSIFTPWGGVTDFANKKTGFPLKYSIVKVDYGVPTVGAQADVGDLIAKMIEAKDNYNLAVNKGKVARRTMDSFTWDDTGRKMKWILEQMLRYGKIKGEFR